MFFLGGSSTETPSEYINFILCEKFGWTFQDLASQPASFIQDILTVLEVVNKLREKELGKNGRNKR